MPERPHTILGRFYGGSMDGQVRALDLGAERYWMARMDNGRARREECYTRWPRPLPGSGEFQYVLDEMRHA